MTLQEGRKRLFEHVENEVKKSGFWIFNKRVIELTITRILQPYERTANFPLPDKIEETDFIIDKNSIILGKEKVYFSQINPKTIYLSSQTSNPPINKSNNPIKLFGDLNLLTKLENAGWKGMLIEVIPVFKTTKKLLQTTKNVEFKKVNATTYEIIIPVKEDKNVYHELLKLALSSTF
jgi:hypothetical protein